MTQPPPYPGAPGPSDEPGGATPPPVPPVPPTQPTAYGSPYGAPQQPAYGAPRQPYPHPYGGGAYPGGPTQDQPSTGMAITALVLSFLACTVIAGIVSIVLAIVVLVRGKDGRNHGKGLAIAALVVSVLMMLATAGVGLLVADFVEEQSIDNLRTGECFNADNLSGRRDERIGLIEKVSCSTPHDSEVMFTGTLTADEAELFPIRSYNCSPRVDRDVLAEHLVVGVVGSDEPEAGDVVACIAIRLDGGQLTEKLG